MEESRVKRALITGVTGQDGQTLTELLLGKGYEVWGLVRGQFNPKVPALQIEFPALRLIDGDLLDQSSLVNALDTVKPDEVYNLGAISFVPMSWKQPVLVSEVTGLGVTRILEAIRMVNPKIHFMQAGSSEQYGDVLEMPQTESTPFNPRSPYGVAKTYGFYITKVYRESYGIHASNAISFNHTGPRRGLEFVTRKITAAIARIQAGKQQKLEIGNIFAKRDWGYSPDFCEAYWRMLQRIAPDDYVIATGETWSVEDFLHLAFDYVGLKWREYTIYDPSLRRPAEVDILMGDYSKARDALGWEPTVHLPELVKIMVDADIERVKNGIL